jgi:adenine-specific DNA-methyltransferase
MSNTARSELVLKLKEIFRSDQSDLDFGIYKILKHRRDEIHRFIEIDLVKIAEEEFGEFTKINLESIAVELDVLRTEINRDFGDETISETGDVTRNHDAPKIEKYLQRKSELAGSNRIQIEINDVFNHVYEFFNRYYDNGDFISQRRFGSREKYVIPHNGEEVSLYWANHDQYYVKTTEEYSKYSFNADGYNIEFRLVKADQPQNNNIGDVLFFLIQRETSIRTDNEKKLVEIFFEHRALTETDLEFYDFQKRTQKSTKIKAIIEKNSQIINTELKKASLDTKINIQTINKQLIRYSKKNDMDYFIHKNLGGFLERELDFYIKNEVINTDEWLNHDSKNDEILKRKIKAIKSLSEKIIGVLDELENYQKMLFEKKKFVIRTDYCISIDRVPEAFYKEIGENKEQVSEWKNLYDIINRSKDTLFPIEDTDTINVDVLSNHKTLVLDTKYFSTGFKYRLLSEIDDLDNFIEGLCIKGDNWHSLNLIENRYNKEANCIYIDPPYNTGIDGFNYKDNYKSSSWYTMILDRLNMGYKILSNKGALGISIDHNEVHYLKIILDSIFDKQNIVEEIIWKKRGGPPNDKIIGGVHESILLYAKDADSVNLYPKARSEKQLARYKNIDNHPKGRWASDNLMANIKGGRYVESLYYSIKNPNTGELHYPSSHGNWRFNKEKMNGLLLNDEIYFGLNGQGRPKLKRFLADVKEGVPFPSIWDHLPHNNSATKEIENLFGSVNIYDTPKPSRLIQEISQLCMGNADLILDFFAGSGTTAEAIIKLNKSDGGKRQYIVMEMGDYFDNLLITRIKKSMYSTEWKNGVPVSKEGITHTFKYQHLEQYEDSLNNLLMASSDGYAQTTLQTSPGEFIGYILNNQTRSSPVLMNLDGFKTPFQYKIKTLQNREEQIVNVDLVETFNYLLGLKVEKIRQYFHNDVEYIVAYGETKESHERILVIWRDFDETILESEKKFIEESIIPELHVAGSSPLSIYVNVDSYIVGAQSIEPTFKQLMKIKQ